MYIRKKTLKPTRQTFIRAAAGFRIVVFFFGLVLFSSAEPVWPASTIPLEERPSTFVEGIPITLKDAVLKALKLRPLRKIDRDRLQNLQYSVKQARSSLFPQISATYQNAYGNSFLGFFLFPGYQFFDTQLTTVTLNQLIFDFGKTYSQMSQREWSARAQKEAYAQTSQSLIRDVENAYYTLLEDIAQETVTRLNVIDARNHLDASLVRYKAGMGLKADIDQAQVNLSNAVLGRIQAVNQRKKDQILLAETIGDTKETHYIPVENFSIPTGEAVRLPQDLEKAKQSNPSLLQARNVVQASRENLKATWRQNYPSINGQAQYFLAQIPPQALGVSSLPTGPYSSFAFTGILSVPIFESGGYMDQVHQARASLNESLHQESETKLSISSQVRQAFLDIQAARQQLSESRAELGYAEEYDRLEEGSYSAGKATALDVIDAQTSLRKARADLVTSKYNLAQKVVLYHYAVGDLSIP
jgi:outer membrane protein